MVSQASRGEEHSLAQLTPFHICFTKGPFGIFFRLLRVLLRSDVTAVNDFWCIQSSNVHWLEHFLLEFGVKD